MAHINFYGEEETLTISPITQNEDGSYSWTTNGKSFWTNQVGQGLFTSTYCENKDAFGNTWVEGNQNHQLEGTSQFSLQGLSVSARRARVIAHAVKGLEGYEAWLYREGLQHSQSNALSYYRQVEN